MNFTFKKIDIVIVLVLIVIAGIVLSKAGYLPPSLDDHEEDPDDDEVIPPPPPPPTPPESLIPGYMRAVSPEDEGVHFDKIGICREWWYYTAIFDQGNSDLQGWTVAVSFNHMARTDLLGLAKPDLLVVTLHGPNGEEYGGIINKERGFGLLRPPTLEAKSPGVSVKYENSWAEGQSPEWHVHAEDNDIDKNHEIIVDLDYFAPSEPLWTIGSRAFDKSKSNIASYVFIGCNVTGTIQIDGIEYNVNGTGYHEHSWSPNIVTKASVNGWDWCHITLDNGWNIYFSNYYPAPQFISTQTSKTNPFGNLIITADSGETLTILGNMGVEIRREDKKIFAFVKMPLELKVMGSPDLLQPFLRTNSVQLEIAVEAENTCEKIWKFPTYVGMKIGRARIDGVITWSDDNGDHDLELRGIGTMWSMRALL
jgi:hypothetical protein